MQIFDQQMDESGFLVSMEAREKVEEIMEYFRSLPRFGNGRFVEKVISQIILNRSEREYTDMDYNRIEKEDVPEIGKLIETNSTGIRFQDPNHITQEDRLRTAYHELGHAIAIYELPTNIILEKISIKSQALSLGRVSLNRYPRNRTEEEMKNEIVVALAGRTAERTILGGCDEGCASDYASAKMTADEMINKYGMCDIGVTTEKDLIREGDEVATKLIKKYQKFIKSVAKDLVAGKEFTGEEFAAMVERFENKKKNKYSVDTEN